MICNTNCQGNGHNKASCDKEPVPKAPIQRKPPGRTRQSVFGTHALARGHGRVLEVEEVLDVVEMDLEEVIEVEDMDLLIELMDEDEIRVNLKYDYMEDLLDAKEDKRVQEKRKHQERKEKESIEKKENERKGVIMSILAIGLKKRPWSTDVQDSDAEVAVIAQDKNKGKDIQKGSNLQSAAKPVMKSKRLRQEEPQPFRINVKNRGR
uniref:Splicing factor n=1 Tax=Tanacetum cinerariifolium TaxID=118510 RepID=A0A6L2NYW7_TANCI|nr:hypothetical protein [Tanacetum cinerariifolium]